MANHVLKFFALVILIGFIGGFIGHDLGGQHSDWEGLVAGSILGALLMISLQLYSLEKK